MSLARGLIIAIMMWLSGLVFGYGLFYQPTKQPTVKCTDGKLYDVSYEGNITILEKRPFTTCEEK